MGRESTARVDSVTRKAGARVSSVGFSLAVSNTAAVLSRTILFGHEFSCAISGAKSCTHFIDARLGAWVAAINRTSARRGTTAQIGAVWASVITACHQQQCGGKEGHRERTQFRFSH